jgi:DNA ligase D-like protein (predicted 3'-phosphoesterase)
MATKGTLKKYRQKRDFGKTPEPAGEHRVKTPMRTRKRAAAAKPSSKGPPLAPRRVFVVQLHDSRHLHYDFRLEVEGVLKSWAVPKGPAMDPAQKRLAVLTEDHPLEYAAFEGAIPEGNYGAGTVIVWEGGTYRNILRDSQGHIVPMSQACEDGHLEIFLEGRKLQGAFALHRTSIVGGGKENWILIKMRDEYASETLDPVQDRPESILTGRTLEEVGQEAGAPQESVLNFY